MLRENFLPSRFPALGGKPVVCHPGKPRSAYTPSPVFRAPKHTICSHPPSENPAKCSNNPREPTVYRRPEAVLAHIGLLAKKRPFSACVKLGLMPMEPKISVEVRQILHRVGLALFVFGLLDIGVMIYCIISRINYSSSFNIFAVISGIYLWRGHPWYVKWVTRAAGFYAGAFCTMIPLAPILFPMDLGVLELRLHPGGVIMGAAATIGVVAFLIWVFRQLRQTPVLAAYSGAGYSPRPFSVAPLCGAMLALGAGALFIVLMHGDAEQKAINLATGQTGPGYHYFVTNLSYAGDRGTAVVLAYDDRAIKTVQVRW